jgi:RNA polymerase sigma-70 factor (ECF subfamily)
MKSMSCPNRSAAASRRHELRRALAFQAVIAKDGELTGLMRRAQGGSEDAYSRLLQELFPLVRKMTRRQMGKATSSDHEDLLQEILLSFHAARATYDPTRPFIPWLKAIVTNRTADFVRKHVRNATAQIISDDLVATIADDAAGDAITRFESIDELRKAIKQLPTRQRSAIELLKLREMSLREAAELTGVSVGALKSSIHRAVGTLRTSLAPYQVV